MEIYENPPIKQPRQILSLPFCQQEVTACAHICMAVAAMLLRSGTTVLSPPTVLDEDAWRKSLEVGMKYYEWALKERARTKPNDKSRFFSADEQLREIEKTHLQQGRAPFWKREVSSGHLLRRLWVTDDQKKNSGGGEMPSLLDEFERCHVLTKTDGRARMLILTDGSAYTRLVIMRSDGLWSYDSHGSRTSTLCYFDQDRDALLVYMLRKCGVTDNDELRHQAMLANQPAYRVTTGTFDATSVTTLQYELLILWKE